MTYRLSAESELMKSHKAAQVLGDTSAFEVVRNARGQSLLFSVGDTSRLYVSAEQDGARTGWTPVDLTTGVVPGATVTAGPFAVCQSPLTGEILVVQVVRDSAGADTLYVLSGLSDDPEAAWLSDDAPRPWVARPYDDAHPVAVLDVAYVRIPVGQDPARIPYAVVGVRASSTYVQNYVVDLDPTTTSEIWRFWETAENYDTLLDMRLGKPEGALSPGLYELYTLGGATGLTFTPLTGVFGPPDVTKLTPPAGATALAVTPADDTGATNLYVAGTGALTFYEAGAQQNFATGHAVVENALIVGVGDLEVHVAGEAVTAWGRTNTGVLFCAGGAASAQGDAGSWSCPIPLLRGVDQVAAMLDPATGSNVLYAHTAGQNVVRLVQDPVTTNWRTQSLLLPPLDLDHVVELYTYATHIKVADENGLPIANQAFAVTATSPGTLYVDDVYATVSPTVPLTVTSAADGTVTIVQEAQTLGAVCYALTQGDGTTIAVNPMAGPLKTMSTISSGEDLAAVTVTDEEGTTSSLVPAGVAPAQTHAVAQGMAQLVATGAALPADGSVRPAAVVALSSIVSSASSSWGMSFTDGDISYFEGSAGLAAVSGDPFSAIEAAAGDIWRWLEHAADDVAQFVVHVVHDVTHFFIEIADDFYHFVMVCQEDIVHALEFVLRQIEVAWEELVQWLGFLFSWHDIVRTHRALKNIFKTYAAQCVADVGSFRAALQQSFADAEKAVDTWAGLPPMTSSAGVLSAGSDRPGGASSPQAHYGTHQLKSNGSASSSSYDPPTAGGGDLENLLDELLGLLRQEEAAFTTAYETLKSQVIDQISTLSATELIERFLAIVFDVVMSSVENVSLAVVDVLAYLVTGIVDLLDAPIDIPVLSWLYKLISGDDLSILDLMCLVVAIPVTVIGKLTTGTTPFPDDDVTSAVVDAPDFAAVCAAYRTAPVGTPTALGGPAGPSSVSAKDLALAGNVTAYFGMLCLIATSGWKATAPSSFPAAALSAVSYLAYVAPSVVGQITADEERWDIAMNTTVCGISVLKALADVSLCRYVEGESGKALTAWNCVSPAGEALINVIWQVPAIGTVVYQHDAAGIIGFVGNTAFDAGGWITPGTAYPKDAETKAAFLVATWVCAGVYGEMMLVQGLVSYSD